MALCQKPVTSGTKFGGTEPIRDGITPRFLPSQTTRPRSWPGETASGGRSSRCTTCPSSSWTAARLRSAAPTRSPFASVTATRTAWRRPATRRPTCCLQGSAPAPWSPSWPACSPCWVGAPGPRPSVRSQERGGARLSPILSAVPFWGHMKNILFDGFFAHRAAQGDDALSGGTSKI